MPRLRLTGRGLWITLLLVPPLAVMAVFVAYPILSALAYAFYDWQGLRRGEFVGLDNFYTVLFTEPWASWTRNAFMHNVIVFFSLMVIQNGLGFVLAYALWRDLPGAGFHRVAVFLPVVLSTVIIGSLAAVFPSDLWRREPDFPGHGARLARAALAWAILDGAWRADFCERLGVGGLPDAGFPCGHAAHSDRIARCGAHGNR
jgi:hypothetical protein